MFSKKELKLAYGLAICLLVIGVLSYAAFSAKEPEEPIRMMFTVAAGKVLFDHKAHTSVMDIGVSCFDCHHHPEGDESSLRACGDCHSPQSGSEEQPSQVCLECHEADEIEETHVLNRGDAFHAQCIDCHKDFEAGPVDCTACHVR